MAPRTDHRTPDRPTDRPLALGPSDLLDFVLCALRLLSQCDPYNIDCIVCLPLDCVLPVEKCVSSWIDNVLARIFCDERAGIL